MERATDWRPIEATPPPGATGDTADGSVARLIAVGLLACAALAGLAVVLWLSSPQPELVLGGTDSSLVPSASGSASAGSAAEVPSTALGPKHVVVDVEGAVRAPGLYSLPAGSRVGDAIAAAAGYSAAADLDAAAQLLNLAAPLNDGDKVLVPRLGAVAPTPIAGSGATPGSPTGPGLIDLNTADEAALDTLPGIGPVTAAKIIAARTEAPFASVDELLARGVVGAATLEKIRALVTVGP